MAIPTMAEQEIERGATQIAKILRQVFEWHENYTPLERVKTVNTNVGMFIFYGLKQPVEVASAGEVRITEAKPHSVTLIAASGVPTTQQKVILLDLIAMRVARKLGVPDTAPIARKDPTNPNAADGLVLGAAAHRSEERVSTGDLDPYKTVTTPYSITVVWAPKGGFADDFNPKR